MGATKPATLCNVSQGSADVLDSCGNCIGSVERRYGRGITTGWIAYTLDGKQISPYPNPKRSMAVREVVRSTEAA